MTEVGIFLKKALHFDAEGFLNGSLALLGDGGIARLVVWVHSGIHVGHQPCAFSLQTMMKKEIAVSDGAALNVARLRWSGKAGE